MVLPVFPEADRKASTFIGNCDPSWAVRAAIFGRFEFEEPRVERITRRRALILEDLKLMIQKCKPREREVAERMGVGADDDRLHIVWLRWLAFSSKKARRSVLTYEVEGGAEVVAEEVVCGECGQKCRGERGLKNPHGPKTQDRRHRRRQHRRHHQHR